MQIHDVTTENFASIIMSDATRSQLLGAMRADTGSFPPLLNHVLDIAQLFETSQEQLCQIVAAELDAKREDFLRFLIFHPRIDVPTLFLVYDSGLCTVDLAHRSGPAILLERIAKEHRIEEAVLTLLLRYYATDDYSDQEFEQFVRQYGDVSGVLFELKNSYDIPEHKRSLGQQAIDEKPS